MLLSLHVKNLALIDETEVFFEPGLNILTGETGAGKSILIGSVNLALGAKADKDMIRTGAESALVELLFQTEDEAVLAKLEEWEILPEEHLISISRRIQPARSICRINGETVNARQVKELAELLIDMHGQHEHQSLLHKKKHMEILDAYAGGTLLDVKRQVAQQYKTYLELSREYADAFLNEEEKKRTFALAEFEAGEIEEAALNIGEDEKLEQEYRKQSNLKRIVESMSSCCGLCGYEEAGAAGDSISRALRELQSVVSFDPGLQDLYDQLLEVDGLLNDFNRNASDYMEDLEIDPAAFEQMEQRLNQINRLKDKYGTTIEEILAYQKKQQELLDKLADFDSYIAQLSKRKDAAGEALRELCETLSGLREKAAKELTGKLCEALRELGFLQADLQIRISRKEEPGETGADDVEFLISTNPGEAVRPLGQIASGGELSRIMLGIKTVLAEKDSIDTLIFDEIDAGISGRTAWQVSRQLGILGRAHQVICITHLPQISAMADAHFKIEKETEAGRTSTRISRLSEKEEFLEIARLLGGDRVTEAALENAREMKKMAKEAKQY